MLKMGNWIIVHSFTLAVPEGEVVECDFDVAGVRHTARVRVVTFSARTKSTTSVEQKDRLIDVTIEYPRESIFMFPNQPLFLSSEKGRPAIGVHFFIERKEGDVSIVYMLHMAFCIHDPNASGS